MSPHHLIWVRCSLFILREAVRWVRTSAPVGCSPRGLGGMSYPFKGFNRASEPPGGDETSCHQVIVIVTLCVLVRG
jgi:hypothetical protein